MPMSNTRARFTTALVALVLLVVSASMAINSFSTATAWVAHTLEVKQAASDWLMTLLDAETGLRGFAISTDDKFAAPYEVALARERTVVGHLRELTSDNAAQRVLVDAADHDANESIGFMREMMGLIRAGHRDEALVRIARGDGKMRMDAFRASIARVMQEEERLLVERRAAASNRWAFTVAAVIGFAAVAVAMLVLAWTSQRTAESIAREAAASRAAADQRDRVAAFQERFIGVLGHDLRNPLNSIMMALDYLERRGLAEAQIRTVARAKSSSQRMRRMIDQILDFTRVRVGGGLPIDVGASDISKVVEELVEEARLANPDRAIDVTMKGDTHGLWDNDRLAQVLSNLLGNAIAHGDEGTVHVAIDGTSPDMTISVSNDGEIPTGVRATLFDPFKQGGSKSARAAGLGLGLYITDQIVRSHGGDITVASSDGKTTFTVKLPRQTLDKRTVEGSH